jgi:hypothetical protein
VYHNKTDQSPCGSFCLAVYCEQSHGFAQLSITRPGARSSGIPNVLFCGASSRPGNGVPLVLIGAKQVAQKATRILQQQLQEQLQGQEIGDRESFGRELE